MDKDAFFSCLRSALEAIRHPQYFEDERAYQGALIAQLTAHIPSGVMPTNGIIQQEPQKTLARHHLNLRPDVIVHEPYDSAHHRGRNEGNHVVIELKRRATMAAALEDFESLDAMLNVLNYPLGIFLNIGSADSFSRAVPERLRARITCLAVELGSDRVVSIRN